MQTRHFRGQCALAWIVGAAPLLACTPRAAGGEWWSVEDSSNMGFSGGHYTSMALQPSGHPAIAFGTNPMQYTCFDGTEWHTRMVGVYPDAGNYCNLALLPSGQPVIATVSSGKVVCQWLLGGGAIWFEFVDDDPGSHVSMAILPDDEPVVCYRHDPTQTLRYAWRDPNETWQHTTVDDSGDVGRYTSLVILPSGMPAVSYADCTTGRRALRYACFDGATWHSSVVDPEECYATRLVLLGDGMPAIAYAVSVDGYSNPNEIRFACLVDDMWSIEHVDRVYDDHTLDLALIDGTPTILYHDASSTLMKLATRAATGWRRSAVARGRADDSSPAYPSLLELPNGTPAICYWVDREGYYPRARLCYAEIRSGGSTLFVNPTTGDDTWDGRCESWDGDACGPKLTIQSAVDTADNGDLIVLAPGTYVGDGNRDIDFAGRQITIRGSDPHDPGVVASTVIDCQATATDRHRAFLLASGESSYATIAGLTVVNGHAPLTDMKGSVVPLGGAVFCRQSGVTLRNCVFTNNAATHGGAIFGDRAQLAVSESTFENNRTADRLTGGTVWLPMGGAVAAGGGVDIAGSDFSGNEARYTGTFDLWGFGGAIAAWQGLVRIGQCRFRENLADVNGQGGAISVEDGTAFLANSEFTNNIAQGEVGSEYASGGAVRMGSRCALTAVNCLFNGNFAESYGGAIVGRYGPTFFEGVNCTFVDNAADRRGDALFHSKATLDNCVVRNGLLWSASAVTVRYSNVEGGWAGDGNISLNPRFVDPLGPDGLAGTGDENFRLRADSPCIDAGDNAVLTRDAASDLDGDERVVDGDGDPIATVDMGAYEHTPGLVGDLNCDGTFALTDINEFVLRLVDPPAYATRHPDCPDTHADINGDGSVNFGDINPFVALVLQGR